MLIDDRRKRILDYLNQENSISIKALSQRLRVSEMTIQRDLKTLEGQGLIQRVRGGVTKQTAVQAQQELRSFEPQFDIKQKVHQPEKLAIARYAASQLVQDGEIIILEGGTTVAGMAQFLTQENLTVLTNGIKTLNQVLPHLSRMNFMVCGGILRDVSYTLVGPQAEAFFASFHAHKLFVSATGLTAEDGLTDPSPLEVLVKQAMRRSARQVILLLDSSKFGQQSLTPVFPLSEVSLVVTDEYAPPAMLAYLGSQGVDVRVVKIDA